MTDKAWTPSAVVYCLNRGNALDPLDKFLAMVMAIPLDMKLIRPKTYLWNYIAHGYILSLMNFTSNLGQLC